MTKSEKLKKLILMQVIFIEFGQALQDVKIR